MKTIFSRIIASCFYIFSPLLLVLTFLGSGVGEAHAVGFAPVRNFSRQTYGAGSQNWGVSQSPSGLMFFANRDGLLRFDGMRWSLLRLPNYTTVRAVFADDKTGRLYAGGSGEFGYFEIDPVSYGYHFVSLVETVPEGERDFTEIWHIHEVEEEKIAFQGDYKVFIWDGESRSDVVESQEKITTSAFIDNTLYLGLQNGALLRIKNRALHDVAHTPGEYRIVGLVPSPAEGRNIIVVTANEGLFALQGNLLMEERWEITDFLKRNQVFCATFSDSFYAFGTVTHGAVVVKTDTKEKIFINKDTGLQDNTVLGLGFDFLQNLWLCLDNGLSYAVVDSPVFNLLGSTSEAGAGYSSLKYGDKLYLATNRGLYHTPFPLEGGETPPRLSRIHSGQVWGLDTVGNDVFISADDGLYLLSHANPQPIKLGGMHGGNWFVAPLKSHPGKALASAYDGFYLLEKGNVGWKVVRRIEGYDDAGGKFVEDKNGNIWITHWIRGVYSLRLSPDLQRFDKVKLYTSADGLPSERDNSLAIYNGKLRISTASGEFFLVSTDGKLVKDENLTSLVPLKYPAHFYTVPSGVSFAFSPKLAWKMTRDSQGKMNVDSVSLRMVASSLIPGFEHVGFLDNNTMLVSHQEGFYSINLNDRVHDKWKNGVFIESITSGDSTLYSGYGNGKTPEIKIPYALNSITFLFAAPEYRSDNAILYSYMLEDFDKEWSSYSEAASKEYTRLHEGSYRMRVKALNTITGLTSETAVDFTVLPPWYRSVWAKIIYALLVIGLLLLIYRIIQILTERKARKVRLQKEAEMEMMRKEAEKDAIKKDYEIASLKSDQLELDVKHKSSELSNTTMNVIRKNEILLDISSKINRLQERLRSGKEMASAEMKSELDKIIALINENISHDDDWKKFNQNFDIVYEDFTKKLAELHPSLTLSDRKLCCYLRMGLSSKEIAPIFSISPKSVEMNRYRLRRKMNLERDINLVEYLHSI